MATSNERKDGGPAFGHAAENGHCCGMTLRDYFAAAAIDRMISLSEDHDGGWDPAAVAAGCYLIADAMLQARETPPEET